METAKYGRMRIGRCVAADLGYIGCETSVMDLADKWCSGLRSCAINVPNGDLDKTSPCFKELKTYLEAGYKCVKVANAMRSLCDTSNYVKLESASGHISSYVAQETGCGSPETPWIIQVEPGQRINLTLLDFDVQTDSLPIVTRCHRYATVRERALNRTMTICGGSVRESHVYLSMSNSLEVSLLSTLNNGQFLLHYETVGCADLEPPPGTWFQRTPLGGDVGCERMDRSWQLTCESGQWVGVIGNCTDGVATKSKQSPKTSTELTYGLSVVIIIGIALLIGLTILCIGLVCFTKRRKPRRRQVKTTRPGGPNTYKLYDKAPCGAEAAMAHGYIHHRTPVSINGNEYSHIWETPIGEAELMGPIHDSPYGTQCDCVYPPKRELFLTKIGEEFISGGECSAHLTDCCSADVSYEGRRYFVVDKEGACADDVSRHSPDVVPPDTTC